MKDFIAVTLTYLAILDSIADIERAFTKLEMIELKRRARRLGGVALSDSLKVAVECPANLDELVQISPPRQMRHGASVGVWWQPQPCVLRAQEKYKTLFGTRRLHSRSLAHPSLDPELRGKLLLGQRSRATCVKMARKCEQEVGAETQETVSRAQETVSRGMAIRAACGEARTTVSPGVSVNPQLARGGRSMQCLRQLFGLALA